MEKSMIQDLENVRTSIGFKNTFTTSSRDGGYDLRKSKISNLPSYKKSDLSIKLPFIVVFQTIQIERLSEEIEALRVALKDSERQAFNCQSYEVQIRQLTDQCHRYDVQLLDYRDQIERLNMISQKIYEQLEEWKQKYQNFDPLVNQKYIAKQQQCQNLQNQISKWRDRYRALEKSKDTELEDLKFAMQSQRKSVLDRQIRQCNLKFQAQRNYLHGQLKKMQEASDQRDDQLTRVKYQAEALRIQNEVNLDAGRKLKQSQNKLNKLTQELVRVNELLRRKQQEIQRKDSNQDYLKQLIKTLERQKLNHQNQAIKVPQLQGVIKEWAVRFSRLQNEHNQTQQQMQKLPILQRNLQNCTLQIERLGMVIKGKMQQLSQSNMKSQKYRSLYEQSKKSEQKVPGLERKITQMNYESQRLNDILKKRLIQIEEAKNRIMSLEKVLRNFEQAEPEKKRIQQQYRRQIRQIEKYRKQISQLERQLKKIPELQAVIIDQRNIREEYAVEVQRLNKVIKQKCDESETLYEKLCHLQNKINQFENIEKELTNYKTQNNRMVQEIDNMNNKIKTKCEEVDELAELVYNLEKNLEQYKAVEQKLIQNIKNTEKIIDELNKTKCQLEDTQKNLLQCQYELNQAKNKILQINNDKEMLNRNLNLKTQELDHTKNQLNTCIEEIRKLREIERKYNILLEEMKVMQNKVKETEENLRRERAKNQQLEYKNQMLSAEIEKMRINGYFPEQFKMMFSQLKSNQSEKQRQIQNLMKKQNAMEKFADQIQGIVVNVCETMKVRNNEWLEMNKKFTDSIKNVQKLEKLQDEINELRVQNLELESKIKVLNLEMMDIQARKASQKQLSPNTFSVTAPLTSKSGANQQGLSASSWSFHTVPSKKTIDPVVEDQTGSKISRVLGNSKLINSTTASSNSKSKYEQVKSSNRFLNENARPSHTNVTSSYQFNSNSNSNSNPYTSPSSRVTITNQISGISGISGYVSPGKTSTVYSTARQSIARQATQSYYTTKVSKTNSVSEPFTFKTSFRA